MKIGVMGVGMVGKAVLMGFTRAFEVVGYDPNIEAYKDNLDDLVTCDFIFVCVPTPTNGLEQDLSILDDALSDLADRRYEGVIIIKSTILPHVMECYQSTGFQPNTTLLYNPEFLKAKTAEDDFLNQKTIVIGSDNPNNANCLIELYADWFYKLNKPQPKIIVKSFRQASMIKYMHNCYLAMKVSIFNDFHTFCSALSIDYDDTVNGLIESCDYIHKTHTAVPGHDGKYGYGGACFPKDTKALYGFAELCGVSQYMLAASIAQNTINRPEYYPELKQQEVVSESYKMGDEERP